MVYGIGLSWNNIAVAIPKTEVRLLKAHDSASLMLPPRESNYDTDVSSVYDKRGGLFRGGDCSRDYY